MERYSNRLRGRPAKALGQQCCVGSSPTLSATRITKGLHACLHERAVDFALMNWASEKRSINMNALEKAFNMKFTENGDIAYNSTTNKLLDLLFMSSYYEKHLDEVELGNSEKEKLFARFMRDPRLGLGRRDLGRKLMELSGVDYARIVQAGRFDDLWYIDMDKFADFLLAEVKAGNELAKKWCPRLNSKYGDVAKHLCHLWGISQKEYRKLIKVETTERKLSEKRGGEINFAHVPSLAIVKYFNRFANGIDTSGKFAQYLEDVKAGKSKVNIATTTVYDIYRNRSKIDADLLFNQLEKISLNCIPIVDVSGSMYDTNDSIGKAVSIGHYLARCSTYAPNMFVTFSHLPELVKIPISRSYESQLDCIKDSSWGWNTNLSAVMRKLQALEEVPEYLVILSDMEFNRGSSSGKDALMSNWRARGINTKIVWWNFNTRATTTPETDDYGNIFFSGYNPMLLKFLNVEFDGTKFLDTLLDEYAKATN